MTLKRIIAPTLLLGLVATLLIRLPFAIADRTSVYEWFDPIVDVRRILVSGFVTEPDEDVMQRAMIDAMIEALDDPYTQYIPPAATDEFNKQLRGTYAGIGAEVNFIDGHLTIVTPMDDSPALRAGVRAGDVVLEIEGESTREDDPDRYQLKLAECVERLTGTAGTPVRIAVRHLDETEEELEIVRGHIVTRTVRGVRRMGEDWNHCVDDELDLHYLRVTQFNASTVRELRDALEELQADGLRGLVLDLRDNPGGSLPTAVGMADLFLNSGTIVSVRGRRDDGTVFTASPEGTLASFAMVVLVNGNSASASEIIAGALKENGRAKIVGSRTFGKGSVQEVQTLPYANGTLKYTTAYYYLPSGRNLNRNPGSASWGVDPDPGLVVAVSDEDFAERFLARRAYEIIRAPDAEAAACVTPQWIRSELLDEELALAVETLAARVRDGAWTTISDERPDLAAFDQEIERIQQRKAELFRELENTEERRGDLLHALQMVDERLDEIQPLAADAGRTPLFPPETDLDDGTITILDSTGNVVGTFRIEGGDVALALDILDLEKIETGDQ